MPAIRAPQSHMSQPRVLCNLQRQTRDKCLHKQAQGETSYNRSMHKLQREPSCMESQMPRTSSETDSGRTTPGHYPAKKRKGSYTEEADNLGDCPLNIRNIKNRLLCGNTKRSPQASANSQAPKGEKAAKAKEKPPTLRRSHPVPLWRKIPTGRGKARHISSSQRRRQRPKQKQRKLFLHKYRHLLCQQQQRRPKHPEGKERSRWHKLHQRRLRSPRPRPH